MLHVLIICSLFVRLALLCPLDCVLELDRHKVEFDSGFRFGRVRIIYKQVGEKLACALDKPFCLALSGSLCIASIFRVSSRSFVNESIIAMVVCVALGLFIMVASIYSPLSVKALGSTVDFSVFPCGGNFPPHTVFQRVVG